MIRDNQKKILEMTPEARVDCRKHQALVNLGIFLSISLNLLGSSMPWIYMRLYELPGWGHGTLGEWVMRSGALMSIFAIVGQVSAIFARSLSDIDRTGFILEPYGPELVRKASQKPVKAVSILTVIVSVWGVLINSHGDLMCLKFDQWYWLSPLFLALLFSGYTLREVHKNKIFSPPWNSIRWFNWHPRLVALYKIFNRT